MECTFHPENHATTELNVHDKVLDDQIQIPICDECVKAYDDLQHQYLKESEQ